MFWSAFLVCVILSSKDAPAVPSGPHVMVSNPRVILSLSKDGSATNPAMQSTYRGC